MVFDAEKVRFAVEYVTRVANDFSSTNMFFVKNCSLLLGDISDNLRAPANESIHSESTWQPSASSHIGSVMSFETEELGDFRGRDPVSAYPLIRLTADLTIRKSNNVSLFRYELSKTLFSSEFLDLLLESLVRLIVLIRVFDYSLVSPVDEFTFDIVIQLEVYDLTSSERVKRGVKRAWLIGETLALETARGQKQPNIHRTKYKGVRRRPSRSLTKPWTAEVKPPMEKNKVWIDDCNTPEAAAHAYDVAAFYYDKGNKALNFEHTPRFLPKTLEYSCEKEKKYAIREQARHLRRNPLFYLIHQVPYDLLFCFVIWELYPLRDQPQIGLALLVVQLMRLVRKDSSVIAFPKWVSFSEEIAHLHAPTNIPQLLESIDCLVKKIPQQKHWYNKWEDDFSFLFQCLEFREFPWKFRDRTKDIPRPKTFQFIEWVKINLVTPQTTSMEAKHLPASPPQCNVLSITLVEVDRRAPQPSSMAMEAEDPLVNIPPQCNTLSMHYPHEKIPNTLEQHLNISHKFSLESQHSTYQDTTPEEQVVRSPIDQAATMQLSSIAKFMDLYPPTLIEALQHYQIGKSGDRVACIEATLMADLEGCNPDINDVVLTSVLGHIEGSEINSLLEQPATIVRSTPVATIVETSLLPSPPLDVEVPNEGFQTGDLYEDVQEGSMSGQMTSTSGTLSNFHPLPFSLDQATTQLMDLDDVEDIETLVERLQHDQVGDIGDRVASVEATLTEGCNPDINDIVVTSVPGHIEGNEINSLCEYECLMEPPHRFAFSQQPFVQFDEYL